MHRKIILFFLSATLTIICQAQSQGPRTSFFYNPATELSWASCCIYFDGGSRQKIQFLPVIDRQDRDPRGTARYSKDIDVKGTLVFAGNGIVKDGSWNSYKGVDIEGKIALICYDFPDTLHSKLESEFSLEDRINEAAIHGALAVVLFSYSEPYPFLGYRHENGINAPEIPAITITKSSIQNIFESARLDTAGIFKAWKSEGSVKSSELITNMAIHIDGRFSRIENDNFIFCFREDCIPREQMENLTEINEKSVAFNLELFASEKPVWNKTFSVYFKDYDSKVFYTHHWGSGYSAGGSTYMVYGGTAPNYGLAVHENTHELINSNWGSSTSFMDEGIAKYAEAQAVNPDMNHTEAMKFLKQGQLFPLKEMLTLDIGSSPKTNIAYPTAGSFVGFLIRSYSLKQFRQAFELESRDEREKKEDDTWGKAYGKPLNKLENEWLGWLAAHYGG